eukprot:GSMAST32.ASY1.ANO1.2149.1 assembled CDS
MVNSATPLDDTVDITEEIDKDGDHSDEEAELDAKDVLRRRDFVEYSDNRKYCKMSGEIIGKGAFKKVYRALDAQKGREVAWSSVPLTHLDEHQRRSIIREVKVQKLLKHRHLLPLESAWINNDKEEVVLITPLGTPLVKFIERWSGNLRLMPVKRWAKQLLTALSYLHTHSPQVVHRDLKCDNILLAPTGDIWLSDYGMARFVGTGTQQGNMTTYVGTAAFMAPEMYDMGSYTEKVDIYAFGMTMIEIMTGKAPHSDCGCVPYRIMMKVTRGIQPKELDFIRDPQAKDFIKCCIVMYKRPDARELLLHPFLQTAASTDTKDLEGN